MTERIHEANIQRDADILYDLTEGLADAVSKLGIRAVNQTLIERLQDTATVLGDTLKELQAQSDDHETEGETTLANAETVAPEIADQIDEAPSDEPIEFESNEARHIVRRYFATRLGDPAAWETIGEHLAKNSVIIPPRRKLNSVIKGWMPDIEQDIADIHGIQIRWINFSGSWVAAEVTRQMPTPAPATSVPVTPTETTPVTVLTKQEYTPALTLEAVCAKIIDLPPRGQDYTRFNTLRNKINLSETAAERLIAHFCEIGALTTFRFDGGRQITANHALARDLDTKPIRQGQKRERHTPDEAPFTNYVSAAMVTDAFLQPRMHIEQALTYREIMNATSYDELTIKEAVKFLKELGILKTDLRFLSRSGHRSSSRQVQKITLSSQALKNQLKSLGISGLIEHIESLATAPGEHVDNVAI